MGEGLLLSKAIIMANIVYNVLTHDYMYMYKGPPHLWQFASSNCTQHH